MDITNADATTRSMNSAAILASSFIYRAITQYTPCIANINTANAPVNANAWSIINPPPSLNTTVPNNNIPADITSNLINCSDTLNASFIPIVDNLYASIVAAINPASMPVKANTLPQFSISQLPNKAPNNTSALDTMSNLQNDSIFSNAPFIPIVDILIANIVNAINVPSITVNANIVLKYLITRVPTTAANNVTPAIIIISLEKAFSCFTSVSKSFKSIKLFIAFIVLLISDRNIIVNPRPIAPGTANTPVIVANTAILATLSKQLFKFSSFSAWSLVKSGNPFIASSKVSFLPPIFFKNFIVPFILILAKLAWIDPTNTVSIKSFTRSTIFTDCSTLSGFIDDNPFTAISICFTNPSCSSSPANNLNTS